MPDRCIKHHKKSLLGVHLHLNLVHCACLGQRGALKGFWKGFGSAMMLGRFFYDLIFNFFPPIIFGQKRPKTAGSGVEKCSCFFDRFCSNVIGQRDRTRRVKHFCGVICHEHSPKASIRPPFIPQNRRLHGKSLHCCQAVLGVSNPAGAGSRSGKSAPI